MGGFGAARTFVVLAVIAATIAATDPTAQPAQVPAGTHVRFHLTIPLSSNESKTGQAFSFVLLEPILVDGKVVAAAGATGAGTLLLAGPAGNKGHEGDLTLRIDSVPTTDGGRIEFDNQHFEVNGVNEKMASAVAGFIPFVGFFAQFIRGQEEHLSVSLAIETELLRPATVVAAAPVCTPPAPTSLPSPATSASPSGAPATSASPSEAPTATSTPCIPPPPPCAPGVPSTSASPVPSVTPTAVATPADESSPQSSESPSAPPPPTPCVPPTPTAWVTPYRFVSPSAPVPRPSAPAASSAIPSAAPSP